MRVSVCFVDGKDEKLYDLTIVGGISIESGVRMALGRAKFEMDHEADLHWETAVITVERWKNV